jgi:hypothetical protein
MPLQGAKGETNVLADLLIRRGSPGFAPEESPQNFELSLRVINPVAH